MPHLRESRVLAGTPALIPVGLRLGLLLNLIPLHALGRPVSVLARLLMLVAGFAAALVPAGLGQLGTYELAVATLLIAVGFPSLQR